MATAVYPGRDYSGNGNDWTLNNFNIAVGSPDTDVMVDTPTPYGTDTGAGGEVRGNYATLNPLRNASQNTIANGNLDVTMTDGTNSRTSFSTIGLTSGKWYWEALVTEVSDTTYYPGFGVNTDLSFAPSGQSGDTASGFMYLKNGQKFNAGTLTSYGASYTNNDVIGVALDMDAGTITFYKNGSSQGQAFSGITGTAVPCAIGAKGTANVSASFNFGQRPFAYTAPSGFKALCTQNLPEPTVVDGGEYFNTVLYTGTGTAQTITGVGFQPDLVWVKKRSTAGDHKLVDAVRGTGLILESNTTDAEANESTNFTGFASDGFSLDNGAGAWNESPYSYTAWNWKANGSGVSNTDGSITSTVSANTTAGFSIVTYTGTGANATVGHGIGTAPQMVIIKQRNGVATYWCVYHTSLASGFAVYLNATFAAGSDPGTFNSTAPTSTVFSIGTSTATNTNGNTYVAYCFAPVEGYSAFGSYVGNGSTDGPFVYCGFRPRWIMFKRTDSAASWVILDSERLGYNEKNALLYANLANAEDSTIYHDILSNGFKARTTTGNSNTSGGTYIYAAFAENPFKLSRAR